MAGYISEFFGYRAEDKSETALRQPQRKHVRLQTLLVRKFCRVRKCHQVYVPSAKKQPVLRT